jgi:hypothetical protein
MFMSGPLSEASPVFAWQVRAWPFFFIAGVLDGRLGWLFGLNVGSELPCTISPLNDALELELPKTPRHLDLFGLS